MKKEFISCVTVIITIAILLFSLAACAGDAVTGSFPGSEMPTGEGAQPHEKDAQPQNGGEPGEGTESEAAGGRTELLEADARWAEPKLEALVREKFGNPGGIITQADLDSVWGIELFGESHIFFNADGGYQMYKDNSRRSFDNHNKLYDNIVEDSEGHRTPDFKYTMGGEVYSRGSISSISDFANFPNLMYLYVYYNDLKDIGGLSSLEQLIDLCLQESAIDDIAALAELGQLEKLKLNNNKIADVSPISNLIALRELDLTWNRIEEFSDLAPLKNLDILLLGGNLIHNIDEVKSFSQLTQLYIYGLPVDDLSVLSGMASLECLYIANLDVDSIDLAPISGLVNLENLWVWQDRAELLNFEVLAGLSKLRFLHITPNVNLTDDDLDWLRSNLPEDVYYVD